MPHGSAQLLRVFVSSCEPKMGCRSGAQISIVSPDVYCQIESMISEKDNNSGALTNAMSGMVDALVPRALKALDRLIGAGVEIPAAWLERHAENIRSKTKSYGAVEAVIAEKAGALASSDAFVVEKAMNNLLRKEYRRTENREIIAHEALELLKNQENDTTQSPNPSEQIDEDWLNVFERFAEDASTERMQKLWSRVLAGEIRRPGAFSLRTLRFLSEFAQSDALIFAEFCKSTVEDLAPKKLVLPDHVKDIRHLLQLEAAGLITGATGLGLTNTLDFDGGGHALWAEGKLALIFRGEPNSSFQIEVVSLTPLGKELMNLLPDRDLRTVMRNVALCVKSPKTKAAFIGHIISPSKTNLIEQIWLDDANLG